MQNQNIRYNEQRLPVAVSNYALLNTHNLSPDQAASWNLLQDYLALQQNAREAGRDMAHLNAAELNELIAISENAAGGITAVWASNALCFQYGICNEALGAPADDKEQSYISKD